MGFCDDMGVIFIPHPPIIGDKLWLPKDKKKWRYLSSICNPLLMPDTVLVDDRYYEFGGFHINEGQPDEQTIVSSDCYVNLMCVIPPDVFKEVKD